MKNKKGFTLIELLAVIIILGILMIIAIPAVTEYISSSRKSAYITTASRYIDGVRNKINAAEIPVYDKETTYYIPGSCVSMEKGGKSPYGDWEEYYVVVTYDGTSYDYYWTSRDETNTGIYLTYQDLLDVDRIENNVTSISTNIGVGDREKILLLKDSCSINDAEEMLATSSIPEKGTSDGSEIENPGNISMATDESCFDFDSETGTITGYKCGVEIYNYDTYQMLDVDKCVSYFSDIGAPEDEARLYCTDDPSFERSLKEDILSGYYLSSEVEQMINNSIIKINTFTPVKDVVIPEKINGVTVTKIGESAFEDSDLYTIEIPKTVIYIGNGSFSNNDFLYNIVNKTGKSFNWNGIISNSDNVDDFIEGEYTEYDSNGLVTRILYVTPEKVDYNLQGMFDYELNTQDGYYNYLNLLDNKGYDVFYQVINYDIDWQEFTVNTNINVTFINQYNYLELNNDNIVKDYKVIPLSVEGPIFEVNVKVEDNDKILYFNRFGFSGRM